LGQTTDDAQKSIVYACTRVCVTFEIFKLASVFVCVCVCVCALEKHLT